MLLFENALCVDFEFVPIHMGRSIEEPLYAVQGAEGQFHGPLQGDGAFIHMALKFSKNPLLLLVTDGYIERQCEQRTDQHRQHCNP